MPQLTALASKSRKIDVPRYLKASTPALRTPGKHLGKQTQLLCKNDRVAVRKFSLKMATRPYELAYSFRGVSPHASHRSEMKPRRKISKVVAIACITPLAAFGVAACGGNKSGGGGGGGGGGDINVALSSFPDYVDPQLSY